MIHPHTELRLVNPEIGLGVFATASIPKGTIIWVQDPLDREITASEMESLSSEQQERVLKYCYRNNRGHFVLCWDHNRYINHSFSPNCMMTPYGLEIVIRDIHIGEELTDDYGYLNILEPFEAFDEGHTRKTVFSDDLVRHHPEWDQTLNNAYHHLISVEQPLKSLMTNEQSETLRLIASGQKPAQSIHTCLWKNEPLA